MRKKKLGKNQQAVVDYLQRQPGYMSTLWNMQEDSKGPLRGWMDGEAFRLMGKMQECGLVEQDRQGFYVLCEEYRTTDNNEL